MEALEDKFVVVGMGDVIAPYVHVHVLIVVVAAAAVAVVVVFLVFSLFEW